MKLRRESVLTPLLLLAVLPLAYGAGAGKSNIPCHGTVISPTDDIVKIINNGSKNQTFCIEGEHRVTEAINVRSGQSLIGTTTNSRISGAVVLRPWKPTSNSAVFVYDGAYAKIHAHRQKQYSDGGANVCYAVSTYMDDLYYRTNSSNDQRIMRVLSLDEVDPSHAVTTQGQAVTDGESGRFFFDYANHRIYLSLPVKGGPNAATVDLSITFGDPNNDALISGAGNDNVTLRNLFIEKGINFGIYGGIGWTLKDDTIRFNHNVGAYNIFGAPHSPALIERTLFTSNGRKAINSSFTTNLTILNSEMSWNNIANFRASAGKTGSGHCQGYSDSGAFHMFNDVGTESQPALVIDKLWSHHNVGDGLWADGGSQYLKITNSRFSANERYGYYHEISCEIQFAGNEVHNNGRPLKNFDINGGGVNVNDSNNGTFTSNFIYDNQSGDAFLLTLQKKHQYMKSNKCLGASNGGDTSNALKHNTVSNNAIYACGGEVSIGKVWGKGGSLNSRGNEYQGNHYHFSDATSTWFGDGDHTNNYSREDWDAWQSKKHDTNGSLTIGCKP